jgi:hypothetical protein
MAKYTKKNIRKNNRKSKKRPIKKTQSKRKYKGGNRNHRYGAKFLFEKKITSPGIKVRIFIEDGLVIPKNAIDFNAIWEIFQHKTQKVDERLSEIKEGKTTPPKNMKVINFYVNKNNIAMIKQ